MADVLSFGSLPLDNNLGMGVEMDRDSNMDSFRQVAMRSIWGSDAQFRNFWNQTIFFAGTGIGIKNIKIGWNQNTNRDSWNQDFFPGIGIRIKIMPILL